jgi:hypothetical protein
VLVAHDEGVAAVAAGVLILLAGLTVYPAASARIDRGAQRATAPRLTREAGAPGLLVSHLNEYFGGGRSPPSGSRPSGVDVALPRPDHRPDRTLRTDREVSLDRGTNLNSRVEKI